MPIYTYRREDGTTFEIRQKFSDDPLTVDPETGQSVTRIVHAAGIVFKGSGFYINDSKGSKASLATPAKADDKANSKTDTAAKADTATEKAPASDSSTPAAATGGSDAAD